MRLIAKDENVRIRYKRLTKTGSHVRISLIILRGNMLTKNVHKHLTQKTLSIFTLFFLCNSLWSAQTSSDDACNQEWFGVNCNVRMLCYTNNQRYSIALFEPEDDPAEIEEFKKKLTASAHWSRPSQEVIAEVTHHNEGEHTIHANWEALTPDVCTSFLQGFDFIKWTVLEKESFLEKISEEPQDKLFLLCKGIAIFVGIRTHLSLQCSPM